MADPLADSREKLKRARLHLADLKDQVRTLRSDPDRHRILVDYDPDQACHVVYSKMSPEPLPNLSLIIGDIIHCARGALDFITWQLACKKLGREPTDQEAQPILFPITPTIDRFNEAKLWPFIGQQEQEEMLRHQPHPGSDSSNQRLAILRWISNRDKHRLILPLSAFIDPPPLPKYTFDPPLPAGSVTKRSLLCGPRAEASDDEIFYKGDPTTVKFGRIEITPSAPDTKIQIDPQVPLDILFRGPRNPTSIPEIEAILDRVEFVIGRFERFL